MIKKPTFCHSEHVYHNNVDSEEGKKKEQHRQSAVKGFDSMTKKEKI